MPTLAGVKSFVISIQRQGITADDAKINEIIQQQEEQHQRRLRQVVPLQAGQNEWSPYTHSLLLVFSEDE